MNITLSYYVDGIEKSESFKSINDLVNFVQEKAGIGKYNFQSLNLSHNLFGEADVKKLVPVLEKMTNLQHLDLSHNIIGEADVKALATALEKMTNLWVLNLSDGFLRRAGAKALATALEKMTNLQHLDLSYNFFSEEDAKALATALEKMINLQHLDLSDSSFGEEGKKALVSVLEKMTNLLVLDLRGSNIKEETLQELKNKLPHCTIYTGYEKGVDLIENYLKVGLVIGTGIGLAIAYYAETLIVIVAGLVLSGVLLALLAGYIFAEISDKVSKEQAEKPGTNTLTALTNVLTRWLRSEPKRELSHL